MKKNKLLENSNPNFRRKFSLIALMVLLSFFVYLVGQNSGLLMTSLISKPVAKPFDGTTYPVQKVPDWSALTTSEYKAAYSAIPSDKLVDLPKYNPDDFEVKASTLKWGDPKTKDLRNAKITYSVPYMGDYSLDAVEYSGSHPATDIKIPMDTPVFAIANGVVIKASTQSGGFGHHVVIEHDNFPSYDNKNELTTYYSSYSHLDKVLVEEGQVVNKGDQIGLSGQTGTATTPHLHFQIDTDSATFHPYWPFTWQEASDAGLDFFSAVNAGLGKERAMETTIDPLMYVQKYSNYKTTKNTSKKSIKTDANDSGDKSSDSTSSDDSYTPVTVTGSDGSDLKFIVDSMSTYDSGSTVYLKVKVLDKNGKIFKGTFDGVVNISLDSDIGSLNTDKISVADFNNGVAKIKLENLKSGESKVKVAYGDSIFYSDSFSVKDVEDKSETVTTSFSDVSESHPNYKAIKYLAEKGVISGYPDGTFKPNAVVSRAEALRFILDGIKADITIDDLPFKDVSKDVWFYKYVSTGYLKSVVSGYNDKTFKPGNVVTRGEFLRMLTSAMDVSVPKRLTKDPFKDVDKDLWYAPYFAYAKNEDIIDSQVRAWPMEGMKRSDVAEAMYRVMTK